MHKWYRPKHLTECLLNGYLRELNATIRGSYTDDEGVWAWSSRYFGLTPQPGAVTNGVVFPIAPRDIDPFVRSEGGDKLYHFVDITSSLQFAGPNPMKPGDRAYTCVVKRPDKTGYVNELYKFKVSKALSARTPAFRAQFGEIASYL